MAESHREEIAKLEALYASNPEGRVFVHLAEAYRKEGEYERARRILEEGLARHVDSASGYVVLGRVLADMEEMAEAETAFRRVIELDGSNLVALRSLGDLARLSGRATEASEYYRDLLARNPSNEQVRELLESVQPAAEPGEPAGPGDPRIPADAAEAPDVFSPAAPPMDSEAAAGTPSDEVEALHEIEAPHDFQQDPETAGGSDAETAISPFAAAPGQTGDVEPAEPEYGMVDVGALPGDLASFAGLKDEQESDEGAEEEETEPSLVDWTSLGEEAELDLGGGFDEDPGATDFALADLTGELAAEPLDVHTLSAAADQGDEHEYDETLNVDLAGDSPAAAAVEERAGEPVGDAAMQAEPPAAEAPPHVSGPDDQEVPPAVPLPPASEAAAWDVSLDERVPEPGADEAPPVAGVTPGSGPEADVSGAGEDAAEWSPYETGANIEDLAPEPAADEAAGEAGADMISGAAAPASEADAEHWPRSAPDTAAADEAATTAAAAFPDESADDAGAAAEVAGAGAEATPERGLLTETMAELYRQQGFLDRAAEVYRALLEERPGDAGLESRLRGVEADLRGTPPEDAERPDDLAQEDLAQEEAEPAEHPVVTGEAAPDEESDDGWLRGQGAAWPQDHREQGTGSEATPYAWTDSGEEAAGGAPISAYFRDLLAWRPRDALSGAEPAAGAAPTAAGTEPHAPQSSAQDEDSQPSEAETLLLEDAVQPEVPGSRDTAQGARPHAPAEDEPWASAPATGSPAPTAHGAGGEAGGGESTGVGEGPGGGGQPRTGEPRGGEVEAAFEDWYDPGSAGEGAPAQEASAGAGGAPEGGEDEDLEMFRSWLQSLKK